MYQEIVATLAFLSKTQSRLVHKHILPCLAMHQIYKSVSYYVYYYELALNMVCSLKAATAVRTSHYPLTAETVIEARHNPQALGQRAKATRHIVLKILNLTKDFRSITQQTPDTRRRLYKENLLVFSPLGSNKRKINYP